MTEIKIYNLQNGEQPYARVEHAGDGAKGFHKLGVKKTLFIDNGFDQKKAKKEAEPILAHNALEMTLALFSTKLSELKDEKFNSVAIACLVSNEHLPTSLKHDHPEFLNAIGKNAEDIKNLSKIEIDEVDLTLEDVTVLLMKHPDLYGGEDNSTDLQTGILGLHTMLTNSNGR